MSISAQEAILTAAMTPKKPEEKPKNPFFSVIVIPQAKDNYAYYIYSADNIQNGYLIDVGDSSRVKKFRLDFGIDAPFSHVMTTHSHFENSAGNNALKREFPEMEVLGGKNDDIRGQT